MAKKLYLIIFVIACLVCTVSGCQKKEADQTQLPTADTTASSTTRPPLTIEDFEKIEVGMTVSEVVEILGCKGKYTGGGLDYYEYEGIDGTCLHLACQKIDEATPKYDENMIVVGVRIRQPEP